MRLLSLVAAAVCPAGRDVRQVRAADVRDVSGALGSGGIDRTYTRYVQPGVPVGLVFSLHGGGSGTGQWGLAAFDSVGDAHRLPVAYPDVCDRAPACHPGPVRCCYYASWLRGRQQSVGYAGGDPLYHSEELG